MNKNIVCLSVGIAVCGGFSPAVAQTASSAAVAVSSKLKKIEVKDYKSFKSYVENEQSKLKTKPLTTENGHIKDKLKKAGIEFNTTDDWARSKDRKKLAVVSPDKKGVAIIDATTQSVNIFNPKGEIVRAIPFPEKLVGRIGFSDTRLFDFKELLFDPRGGFFIYNLSGRLVKKVDDSGIIDAFIVANNQRYLAVTSTLPEAAGFFILYDMDGTELWRRNTVIGTNPQIKFSLDDKFVLVKMPVYWLNHRGEPKERKLYIFNVKDGRLLSDEHYED